MAACFSMELRRGSPRISSKIADRLKMDSSDRGDMLDCKINNPADVMHVDFVNQSRDKHNSNPLCKYVTYGPLCAPKAQALGTDIYQDSYGGFEPSWKPAGCP